MSLTGFSFFAFFAVLYALLWVTQWTLSKRADALVTANKVILILASYFFLAFADYRFCFSVMAITLISYFLALGIEKENKNDGKKAKLYLLIGVIATLAMLGFFKYCNFFLQSLCSLFGKSFTELKLIIPLGISFYSFFAVSYLMDVYRKKYSAYRDFLSVALFIAFFAKLTSGPVVRANKFIDQLNEEHHVSLKNLETGIQIVAVGLFKKMVLADHLSVFVDDVFGAPKAFSGFTVLFAIISYALQIYFDFAGYSDIAIGIAKILGYDLDKNFDLPYASLNPTEFWKRWHITLSSWLQEYLYYPLGGNRKGKIRTYINLFLTMLIGGLWHGANWTFVIWGAINGMALVVHKIFLKWKVDKFGSRDADNKFWKTVSGILTFVFVCICWVFFRASSVGNAFDVFGSVFNTVGITQIYSWAILAVVIAAAEIIVAIVKKKKREGKIISRYIILDLSKLLPLALFFAFVGITAILAYLGDTSFIYGKF